MTAMRLTPDMVARCFRPVPEPGTLPDGRIRLDDAAIDAVVAELAAGAAADRSGSSSTDR